MNIKRIVIASTVSVMLASTGCASQAPLNRRTRSLPNAGVYNNRTHDYGYGFNDYHGNVYDYGYNGYYGNYNDIYAQDVNRNVNLPITNATNDANRATANRGADVNKDTNARKSVTRNNANSGKLTENNTTANRAYNNEYAPGSLMPRSTSRAIVGNAANAGNVRNNSVINGYSYDNSWLADLENAGMYSVS